MEIQRLHVGKVLSEVAVHNGTVYLAGQIADDATQNIASQTREVLANIDRLLSEANTDKSRILMCQIFLADIKDFAAMNAVWSEWVADGASPPRATVEAKLAKSEWLVEMVVTAAQRI
jgi:enamine deaminase RidA (YjgF/YER057c/UK114 family)